jgi:hypothetical protein
MALESGSELPHFAKCRQTKFGERCEMAGLFEVQNAKKNGEMEEASDFAALIQKAEFRVWDEEVVRMSRAIKHSDARLQHKCWIGQESSCYTSARRATLRVNSVE